MDTTVWHYQQRVNTGDFTTYEQFGKYVPIVISVIQSLLRQVT